MISQWVLVFWIATLTPAKSATTSVATETITFINRNDCINALAWMKERVAFANTVEVDGVCVEVKGLQ